MEIPKYFYFRVRGINKGTSVEMEDASDVDVVEVIRCKDCRYFEPARDGWGRCTRAVEALINGTDFCSFGERKEE